VQIINGVRSLKAPFVSSALTIGNFDGVHLGHQALIERVVDYARRHKVAAVVMTFEPHPVKVLYPDRKLNRILSLDDLQERMRALGVDALVVEPFSREFSQLSPERYLQEWIYRPFQPGLLVVGYDFSFGADRKGSIDFLREHTRDLGIAFEVVPPVKVGEELVSSSRIRQALQAGEVALARLLLGRPFYLRGLVERGAGRGRTIGIPTANLRATAETIPAKGVYCAWVTTRHGRFKSVVNVGVNPTFSGQDQQALSVEAHLLGVTLDLYGDEISIDFIDRLRDERRFASAQELVKQIQQDILQGERRLDVE
jgi:riboflavin kinase/FMN adenylyltransferase